MYNKSIIDITNKIYDMKDITPEEHAELIKAIKKGNKNEKIYLARVLSILKDPNDLKYILEMLNMQSNSLSLIEAVSMYGPLAIEELKQMLKNAEDKRHLRKNIISVFAFLAQHLQREEVLPIFIKYLNDAYKDIRIVCLHGISKLKSEEVLQPLSDLVEIEPDEQVKNFAQKIIESLGQF